MLQHIHGAMKLMWYIETSIFEWNGMEWNGKYPSTTVMCVLVCMRPYVCACTCIYTRPCTSDVKYISYQGLHQNI